MLNIFRRHNLAKAAVSVLLTGVPAGLAAQERSIAWGYNSFGVPGMIDMPTAFGRADGELGFTVSHFKKQTRNTLTFQLTERLSGSFRYSILSDVRRDPGSAVQPERYDRSFSLQYRFANEGRYRPAMAIGINDIVGTGLYGGEYFVASKTFTPTIRATAGIGWGRLGSHNGFSNPLSSIFGSDFDTRSSSDDGLGGTFEADTWFRGDAAFFGGIEWQATDRWRLTAEYSSDAYLREDGAAFDHKSPFNFGASYQYNDRLSLDLRYLYGSEVGVQFSYAINPKKSRFGSGLDNAPPPILPAARGRGPEAVALMSPEFTDIARQALAEEGIALDGMKVDGKVLRVQVRNDRYGTSSQATGRTARILSRIAPARIKNFDIRLAAEGMPVTSVILRRDDLERLEFHPVAPDLLRVNTQIVDATESLPPIEERYPAFTYGIEPYITPSFFDPDEPLRADAGLALSGRYEPRRGLVLSGRVNQKLFGNLDEGTRESTSVLPRVRSEAYRYYKGGDTTIPELTAAYFFRPGDDVFGRVTVGYLESMFGGVSAELLWKPQNSRLAFGAEVNYVKQRDFNQLFGFQDYETFTGHASAYYDIGGGFQGQLDVGQYLAGDVGATLSVGREFENGWRVGAFATVTDVSAEDFGEGSFDKGIEVTIPIDWITGRPSKTKINTTIRPVQRDGGARLNVSNRLYDTVRELQATDIDGTWGRFFR